MADKDILRKYNGCHARSETLICDNEDSNRDQAVKSFSFVDNRSSLNIFKRIFTGSKFHKRRSKSSDKSKKSPKYLSNPNTFHFSPQKCSTLDRTLLSQRSPARGEMASLMQFSNHRVGGRSFILRNISKLDVLDEQLISSVERNPFIREMHNFLCSEKLHMMQMLRNCGTYSDPLRKFSSLSHPDRCCLFYEFEIISEKLSKRCQQAKLVINDMVSSQQCTEIFHLLRLTGIIFSGELCDDLHSYARQIPQIEKLHAKLLKNDEYREFISIVEGKHPSLITCLQLPLIRTTVYSETLRNLLSISDQLKTSSSSSRLSSSRPSSLRVSSSPLSLSSSASSSSPLSRPPSASRGTIRLLRQNLLDVQHCLSEMSAGINNSLDWLQKLFPHDDLLLGFSVQRPGQRTTLPAEPIKRYKLTSKKRKPTYNSSVPSFSQLQFSPDRALLLCSSVQVHKSLPNYTLFLLTDVLMLAKGSIRESNLELRQRIDVSQMWVKEIPDDAKNIVQSANDNSLVIGWPMVNMNLMFETVTLRNRWKDALSKQIALEKAKEIVKFIFIKVEAKMADATMCKMMQVKNDETTNTIVQRLVKELRIENREVDDFQLWVAQDSEEPSFELYGYEFPFSIQLHDLRHSSKDPNDKLAIIERRPLFLLRDKKKARANSDEQLRAAAVKSKRKKLKNIFKLSKNPNTSKFFGLNLSAIFIDGYPPLSLKRMLEKLFEISPYCNGVFRKSANHAKLKQIIGQLDSGLDIDFTEVPVIMIANIMKKFLRSLPDCLLMSHLYYQWLEVARETDEAVIVGLCKKQYNRLLPFNQSVLLDLICILRRIEEHHQYSNMTANSLAICIGPSLLWAPRVNNNSNGSNSSLGVGMRKSNDADDEMEGHALNAIAAAAAKYDMKINSDIEDINRVIEMLIKHASKIFGDDRYNFLTRSLECNSLRVKPSMDSKDVSTDGESAISSEACEGKSHFSSMGTVEDSAENISGDEKYSSVDDTQDQSLLKNFMTREQKLSSKSEEDVVVENVKLRNEVMSRSSSMLSNFDGGGEASLNRLSQSMSIPRLKRQQRLSQESFELRPAEDRREESQEATPRKETISSAFANIARKIKEGKIRKANSTTYEMSDVDCTIVKKSVSLYDASDHGDNKVGILQRRGMTEKGEDVFPKQIVHSLLPSNNVSPIDLKEEVKVKQLMKFDTSNNLLSSSSVDACNHQNFVDSQMQKSGLSVNQKVMFGKRRLPQKFNMLPNRGFCTRPVLSGPMRVIRLPPPSYEEATKYLKTKNLCRQTSIESASDVDMGLQTQRAGDSYTTEHLTVQQSNHDNKIVANSNVHFKTKTEQEVVTNKENIGTNSPSQKTSITKVFVNVIKGPAMLQSYPKTFAHFEKRIEQQSVIESVSSKLIKENEDWHRECISNSTKQVDLGETSLLNNNQRRRRRPKRHSDPRLGKSAGKKPQRYVNRSRSDVADSFQESRQQKFDIPDILEDLKRSGILVEFNKNERSSPSNPRPPPRSSSTRDVDLMARPDPQGTRALTNKDWRVRLAKHFREIDENATKGGCENEEHPARGIPSSIVGNRRLKFERLNSSPDDDPRKKAGEESKTKFHDANEANSISSHSSSATFSNSSSYVSSSTVPAATTRSESHSMLHSSEIFESQASMFNNFKQIKSMFDGRTSSRELKAVDKTKFSKNKEVKFTRLDVVPNNFIDFVSSSSSSKSKHVLGVGQPVTLNVSLSHVGHATQNSSAAEVFRSRSTRSEVENIPWKVSELKKIYTSKNSTSLISAAILDPLKRQSLPAEASRRCKH